MCEFWLQLLKSIIVLSDYLAFFLGVVMEDW